MIQFPISCVADKNLPKKEFYSQFKASGEIKRRFVEDIQSIRLMYIISPEQLPIKATDGIVGILVLKLTLKQMPSDYDVLRFIDTHMKQHILFVLECDHKQALVISYKQPTQKNTGEVYKIERFFFSEWKDPSDHTIQMQGTTTSEIYESFIRDVDAEQRLTASHLSMAEKIDLLKQMDKLTAECNAFTNKMNKEKQFNKRVEMNKRLSEMKNRLSGLESQLKTN